jgi:hypothetical protein
LRKESKGKSGKSSADLFELGAEFLAKCVFDLQVGAEWSMRQEKMTNSIREEQRGAVLGQFVDLFLELFHLLLVGLKQKLVVFAQSAKFGCRVGVIFHGFLGLFNLLGQF